MGLHLKGENPASAPASARFRGGTTFKARRTAILKTATRLFRRKGYVETTMQDIGDAVGINKISLYNYVDSKEWMLFSIVERVHADGMAVVESIDFESDNPLFELRKYLAKAIRFALSNKDRLNIFFQDFQHLPEATRRQIIADRGIYVRAVRGLIEKAQQLGQIDGQLSVPIAAKLISGAIAHRPSWDRWTSGSRANDVGVPLAAMLVRCLPGNPAEERAAIHSSG